MAQTKASKRGYTTEEAAHYCGVSQSLLRQSRMKNPSPSALDAPKYTRLGGSKIIYLVEDLNEWLDGHAAKTSGGAVA